MSNETVQKPQSDGFFNKIRAPLLFGLTLILAFGVYYFFFVQKKASYLTSRNFRFLSAIGTQVETTLRSRGTLLENLGKNCEASKLIHADEKERKEKEEDYRAILTEFAPSFEDVTPVNRENKTLAVPRLVGIRTALHETRIEVFRSVPDAKTACEAAPTQDTQKQSAWYGWIKPQSLLEPLFHSRKAFDAVLLADAGGEVVYQQGARELNVTRLGSLVSGTQARDNKDKALGNRESAEHLSGSGKFYDVELSGREYRLFIEPVLLPLQRLEDNAEFGTPPEGSQEKLERVWLVCGLAPKKELVYSSLAVSSALLTALFGFLILAGLSWPFLKLRLLGDTQRIGLFDILMLGTCSLLGLSIATIFLLDLWTFKALKQTSAEQLEQLAEQIEENARTEIQAAYKRLSQLEEEAVEAIIEEGHSARQKESRLAQSAQTTGGHSLATSFLLLGANGMQEYKWTLNKRFPPRIAVREREYFRHAIAGNPYVESLVGHTSGLRMAVVSKPVTQPILACMDLKVAALGIPMISLIDPVLPPGFKFAVVDNGEEKGRVLFHSDPTRNLTEDFLIETDRDRHLRSILFARRAETLRIRYWGEDYIARTMPLGPWTVIALRDLQMLRAVNLEWVSTTLLFVFLYVGFLTVVFLGIAVARPSYRAEWLWPNPLSRDRYQQLVIAYLLITAAFLLSLRALRESNALFITAALLPALSLIMAYLKLQNDSEGHEKIKQLAFGIGLGLLTVAAAFLLSKPNGADFIFGALAFLLLFLAFLSTRSVQSVPLLDKLFPVPADSGSEPHSVSRSYCLAGSLLLLLTAVLPTASFFQASHRIHMASFKKHGQLQMARDLNQRALRAQQEYTDETGDGKAGLLEARLAFNSQTSTTSGLDVYTSTFYETNPEVHQESKSACEPESGTFLSEALEGLLPRSSEHASEMREMFHRRASDCAWQWQQSSAGGGLALQFDDYPGGDLQLSSGQSGTQEATSAVFRAGFSSLGELGKGLLGALVVGVSMAALLLLIKAVVTFMARHVFLIDLLEPLWSEVPVTGRNVFVVGNNRRWKEKIDITEYHWFDIKKLDDPEEGWPIRRPQVLDDELVIVVDNFEHNPSDEELARRKLRFLEDLVRLQDRTVVVFSTKSPDLLFSRRVGTRVAAPSATLEQRWKNLQASFVFREQDLRLAEMMEDVKDAAVQSDRPPRIDNEVLEAECGPNPRLQAIARRLAPSVKNLSREQVLEEFGERAESYYRALWASCTTDEQVVLEHLAETGLVNEKSRKLIRRLMARGLVRRDAAFHLMNETFRQFVSSSNCRGEILAIEKSAGPSAWDRLRGPFFASLAASVVFFFTTQQALFDGVLAGITGLTAGLPAMVKAFDFFSHRPRIGSK